jgi:hypothetical protein
MKGSMTNTKKSKATGASLEERTAMFDAVYAPLMGRPVSDQGRAVVARLCMRSRCSKNGIRTNSSFSFEM